MRFESSENRQNVAGAIDKSENEEGVSYKNPKKLHKSSRLTDISHSDENINLSNIFGIRSKHAEKLLSMKLMKNSKLKWESNIGNSVLSARYTITHLIKKSCH